jgi:surface protein
MGIIAASRLRASAIRPFIIEVDTTKAGSASDSFQFTGAEGDYDVVAKQNNIVVATFNDLSNQETITLPSSGIYVLEITPKYTNGFNRIRFGNVGDKLKITDIKQWGDVAWSSFSTTFAGCFNLIGSYTDRPNLSNVNNLNSMFDDCRLFNSPVNDWDTSNVTNMANVFRQAFAFNQPLNNWDTSNVTTMVAMFIRTRAFNQPLNNWDTSNVTNMVQMFEGTLSANPNTSNWDTSSVTSMRQMFRSASSANPDVSSWNTSSVINMRQMFRSASSANPDTSNWDTSSVISMRQMFRSASSANPDTSNWDVSSVTNMSYMFYRASSANPDVSSWNTSSVINMSSMFRASSANPDVSSWNTSSVINMSRMFRVLSANPDTTNWDISNVVNMSRMFENSNLSEENLTACYENWSQLNLQQDVPFSAGTTEYNASGQEGRDILINTYNWSITDGGENLFLNQFSGASLGLSLDLLDSDYTGSAIKVRRSSDNTELDIGFVNGILDTASLLNFVGSGNGFVPTIYDQVGSNNMTQTTANLQGQIVSNGSVIIKGGKPCIIRSANDDGGYISTYEPNDGVTVKGVFYVGDNEGRNSILLKSASGNNNYIGVSQKGSDSTLLNNHATITTFKINGISNLDKTRVELFTATDLHFILSSEIEFNFLENKIGLGYVLGNNPGFGMYSFQELVIFENTDDAVAKENNINTRYNNIY